MTKVIKIIVFILPLLFSGNKCVAQTDSLEKGIGELTAMSLEELMNLKVAGSTRTEPERVIQTPASVIVITARQIEERGYQSLFDLLMDMPDIKTDRISDPRWMNEVTMRGVRGTDKFIILLDGIRISSPTNDIIPVLENYPLHLAKQVEIIYGPGSALYGADAFSGVINIVSKSQDEFNKPVVSVTGGMYNKFNGNLILNKRLSKGVALSVGGQYFFDKQPEMQKFYKSDFAGIDSLKSGVFNSAFGPIKAATPVNPLYEQPITTYALNASLYVREFKFSFFKNYASYPTAMANSPNNTVYNKDVAIQQGITMLNAGYAKKWNNWLSQTMLVGSRYDMFPGSNFRNIYTGMEPGYLYGYGNLGKVEQLITYKKEDDLTVTAGGTYETFDALPYQHDLLYPVSGTDPNGVIVGSKYPYRPKGIEVDLQRIKYHNAGALLQANYRIYQKLRLIAGGRYDHNSRFGSTINPRTGLVYELNNKLFVKALYGTAFLAPAPHYSYETYGTFASADSGKTFYSSFFQLPNPNLKPQKVRTCEVALKYFITGNLSISANTYYSNLNGLISYVSDSAYTKIYNGTYLGYPVQQIQVNGNLGHQTVYGGTLQIENNMSLSSGLSITSYAALSFIDGKLDIDEGGPVPQRNLPGVAPYTFRAGATIRIGGFSIAPRLIWVGKQRTINVGSVQPSDITKYQEIKGYQLVNACISYQYNEDVSFFILGENLLNQRYRNINIGAAPQSPALGSAAAEFKDGSPQYPIRINLGIRMGF